VIPIGRIKRRLSKSAMEGGASAVEYAVLIALIAAVIVASVGFLGAATSGAAQCTAKSLRSHTSACPPPGRGGSGGSGHQTR
jgi:Flp pilus assembly pilin Flp